LIVCRKFAQKFLSQTEMPHILPLTSTCFFPIVSRIL
jgi:hypothetical protein